MAGEFSAEGAAMVGGLRVGLYQFGIQVFGLSQTYVPVDTGVLKASGRLDEPVQDGDEIMVKVSYGSPDATATRSSPRDPDERRPAGAYALPVHERVELRHEVPTRAKYLESSVLELAPEFEGVLAAAMTRGAMEAGFLQTWLEDIPLGQE